MNSEENIGKEADYNARQKTVKLLQKKGPKLDKVLLRLRQALNAKDTKVVKLKGAITKDELPKGFDLIVNTGLLTENDDGDVFGTGESLISYDLIAHGHRLKAVDLALQLHDAMPSQKHKHEHSADPGLINAFISGLPPDVAEGVCRELNKYVSSQRNRSGTPKKN